jgi:uncharacterized phage protein gp47/JayE
MAYVAPYVDATGLHINTYQDILQLFLNTILTANGQIVYLAAGTSDYQEVSTQALACFDAEQAAQLAYNQRSILTAIGSGLDTLGANLGLPRKVASYSTVAITIVGVARTYIANGVVQDNAGLLWALTPGINIPNTNSITVTGTCQTLGAIGALPGAVNVIATPVPGWTSANNTAAAIPGAPTELDSQYRGRLMASAAINSRTLLAGTQALIAALPNVTRVLCIDNKTNSTDPVTGTPAHSVSCVVEGGDSTQIATTIAANNNYALPNGQTPNTSGSTSVVITDPYTSQQEVIGFYRPTYIQPYVTVNISQLAGYTTQVAAQIQANVVAYLNSLDIGNNVITYGEMWAAVYGAPNPSPTFSVNALYLDTAPNTTKMSSLPMQFYQVAQGVAANIVVNVS